ncbi:MAG: hypothetical protein HY727_21865 [Candidatus Rokubacteria bacterium]|nr:hypothetical protein [Candidatus Rokubacteria bacterium]
MTPRRLVVTALLLAGCATWSWHPSTALLAQADRLSERGEYARAVEVYDEFLARHSDDGEVPRARARRATAAAIVSARAEIDGLRRELGLREAEIARMAQELGRLGRALAAREGELASRDAEVERLRLELAARQAEVARLASEAERLGADLERLKRIDMRLERRRP